jgi:zinc protease
MAYTPALAGLFVVGGTCKAENLEESITQLSHETLRLTSELIGIEELTKIKTMMESDSLYMRETVQGMARRAGYYQVLMNDPGYGDRYLGQIMALTPDALLRVAKNYLKADKASFVSLLPKAVQLKKPTVRNCIRSGAKMGIKKVVSQPSTLRKKIRKGHIVLLQEDHTNALVAMQAVFLAGSRFESDANSGIGNFFASLLTQGTTQRSAEQVAQTIDSIAGSLKAFSGRNTFGLRAEFPVRHLEQGMMLFADCLLHPAFSPKEIEQERELILSEIANRQDNLSGVAFDLFSATLYQEHPYRLPILGTPETVSSISRADLVAYYDRHFCVNGMVLGVAGDVHQERVLQRLEHLFPRGAKPKERLTLASEVNSKKIRTAICYVERSQAHIVLGFLGATLNSRDRFALEVLMSVLAGQGGRLFVELRDRRSLAYSVTSFAQNGLEPGFVAVYLGVDPRRCAEAIQAVLEQLDRVVERPVSGSEIDRAKRYLVGSNAISLQRVSARAAAMTFNELYGVGYLAHTEYAEKIKRVSVADVHKAACNYLRLNEYSLAVVGPESQMRDDPALLGLGF